MWMWQIPKQAQYRGLTKQYFTQNTGIQQKNARYMTIKHNKTAAGWKTVTVLKKAGIKHTEHHKNSSINCSKDTWLLTGKDILLTSTVKEHHHQHSERDSTKCLCHMSVDCRHCGYSSQDWQVLGLALAVDRLASEAGNIATETGTLSPRPLTMHQFFANTACFFLCDRCCSVAQQQILMPATIRNQCICYYY